MERKQHYEKRIDLQEGRGELDPKPAAAGNFPKAVGKVRQNEKKLPAGVPAAFVQSTDPAGTAFPTLVPGVGAGNRANEPDDCTVQTCRRCHGRTESGRPHGVGPLHEQHSEPGRRNCKSGADLQLRREAP